MHAVLKKISGSSMAAQSLQTVVTMVGVMVLNMGGGVLLSRGLGPLEKGVFISVTIWGNIAIWVCDVGLYNVTVYMWRRYRERNRAGLFTSLLTASIMTSSVTLLVSQFIIFPFLYHKLGGHDTLALRMFLGGVALGPIRELFGGILTAEFRLGLANMFRIAVSLLTALTWAAFYFWRAMSVADCLYASALIGYVVSLAYFVVVRPFNLRLGKFDKQFFKESLWYGLKGHGATISGIFAANASQVVLSVGLPPVELGYYSTANSSASPLGVVPNALGITSLPRLVDTDKDLIHNRVTRLLRMISPLYLALGSGLGLLLPLILPLLYGHSYSPAVIPAEILLFSIVLRGLAGIIQNALLGTGNVFANTINMTITAIITVGAMVLLGPTFGARGAAIAALAGQVFSLIASALVYRWRIHNLTLRDCIPSKTELSELAASLLHKLSGGKWRLAKR